MNVNAKQIIALLIGLLATAVTAWKGPQAWGLIASGLVAVVMLVSTLKLTPKEDEEYIQDLEDALTKQESANTLAARAANASEGLRSARSRARFNARKVRP